MAEGPVPAPSCLERSPNKTGTARGCFCPEGTFLQDGQCVQADRCRCLHEGVFYNVSFIIPLLFGNKWHINPKIKVGRLVDR